MRKAVLFGLAGAALAIAAAFFLRQNEGETEDMALPVGKSARSAARKAQPAPRRAQKPHKTVLDLDDDDDDNRSPAEKALAERIDKALEDEDFELAASCADEAQKCGVVEIRQSMVETLGWFGEKALPELTPFIADPDEDVRENAMNEWTMALSSIEDDVVKIKTVELAMSVLKDEEALEDISGEYIGVDEKLAVESLARIIGGGGSKEGVDKAKETYEIVTGEEWTDAAAAERWIAEEYEPSEES